MNAYPDNLAGRLTPGGRPGHPSAAMRRPHKSRKVTIADVAERAGVSKTTVSHVLSRNRPVASGTSARVELAVAELGYRPDGLARSLRTRRSHTVALIIPDITNPFYPVLARGLEDGLAQAGYRTFVCNTDSEEEQELEYISDAFHRRVDGVVLVTFYLTADRLPHVLESGMPLVSIGVLVLAGLSLAASAGGLGIPAAARTVPVASLAGPVPEQSTAPIPSSNPSVTFEPPASGAVVEP